METSVSRVIINGRSGAGKDVIADYLVSNHGFVKVSFASYIYVLAKELFQMKLKDRYLLQQIGEKLREIDPDVWVKRAFKEALEYERVVIGDCRRGNEYSYAIQNGFKPIRVSAPFEQRVERCRIRDGAEPDTSLWNNQSETGADDFEYTEIDNSSTLHHLYSQIERNILS